MIGRCWRALSVAARRSWESPGLARSGAVGEVSSEWAALRGAVLTMAVAFALSATVAPFVGRNPQFASATWPRVAGAVAVFCWFSVPLIALGCAAAGPLPRRLAAFAVLVAWAALFALITLRTGVIVPVT